MSNTMIITDKGDAIIADLLKSKKALDLKYVAIGENTQGLPIDKKQTSLYNETHRGLITNYTIVTSDEKTVSINYVIPQPETSPGYTIRECGIFDETEDGETRLIAVGSINTIYIPSKDEEQGINLTLRCILTVQSELNITLSTDPYFKAIQSEIIAVTDEIFEQHNVDPNAHPNIAGIPSGGKDGDIIVKYGEENKVSRWKSLADLMKDENDNFYFG